MRSFGPIAGVIGHRSSTCNHDSRPLIEIKKKGRPVTQCMHCRELRKTKQVHVKCLCEGRPESASSAPRTGRWQDPLLSVSLRLIVIATSVRLLSVVLTPSAGSSSIVTTVVPQITEGSLLSDYDSSCDCKSGGSCTTCCIPRKQHQAAQAKLGAAAAAASKLTSSGGHPCRPSLSILPDSNPNLNNRASPSSSSVSNDEESATVSGGAGGSKIKPASSRNHTSHSHPSSSTHVATLATAKRERERELAMGHEVGGGVSAPSLSQRSSSLHGSSGTSTPHHPNPHPHPLHHHIPHFTPYSIQHHHHPHSHRSNGQTSPALDGSAAGTALTSVLGGTTDSSVFVDDNDFKKPALYTTSMSTLDDGTMTVLRRNRGRSASTSHHEDISRPFPPPPVTMSDSGNDNRSTAVNGTSNTSGIGTTTPFYMNSMAAASLPDVLSWPANLQSIGNQTSLTDPNASSSNAFAFMMPSASASATFDSFMANPFQNNNNNSSSSPSTVPDTSPFDDAETFAALQQGSFPYIPSEQGVAQYQPPPPAMGYQLELPGFRFEVNGEQDQVQSPSGFEQEFDDLAAYSASVRGVSSSFATTYLGVNGQAAPEQTGLLAAPGSMAGSSRPPSMTMSVTSRSSSRASEGTSALQGYEYVDASMPPPPPQPLSAPRSAGEGMVIDTSTATAGTRGRNYVRYSLPTSLQASAVSLPLASTFSGNGTETRMDFPSNIADPFEDESTAITSFDLSATSTTFGSVDGNLSSVEGDAFRYTSAPLQRRHSHHDKPPSSTSPFDTSLLPNHEQLGIAADDDDGSGTTFPAPTPSKLSWSPLIKPSDSPSTFAGFFNGEQRTLFDSDSKPSLSYPTPPTPPDHVMTNGTSGSSRYYSPPPGPPPLIAVASGARTFASFGNTLVGAGGGRRTFA